MIVDGLIRQLMSIDDSQLGFVLDRGTTDAIFVVRQLQETYLAANMAFIDLEKAFDRVPLKVIYSRLCKHTSKTVKDFKTGHCSLTYKLIIN